MPDALHQAVEAAVLSEMGWSLDEADILNITLAESGDSLWRANVDIAHVGRRRLEFMCRQTGEIHLKSHCNYDIEDDFPQYSVELQSDY